MIVDSIFDEVEKISLLRNHEVIMFIMNRLCGYQKTNLKLDKFIVDIDKVDFGLDYENWRELKKLRKKLSFKTPCGLCVACRNK
jgi:hypothetical protein